MNGERVSPPLSPVAGLTITMNSKEVKLTTDFGLTVRFDSKSRGGKRSGKNMYSKTEPSFFLLLLFLGIC